MDAGGGGRVTDQGHVGPQVADCGPQSLLPVAQKLNPHSSLLAQEPLHAGGQLAPGEIGVKKQVHTPKVVEVVVVVVVVVVTSGAHSSLGALGVSVPAPNWSSQATAGGTARGHLTL